MINKETLENVKAVQNSYDETPYKFLLYSAR